MKWLAPAKINLFLHITGRRQDGYHELQTAFQFLDYSDELSITPLEQDVIDYISPIDAISTHQDLVYKAASLLKQHTGTCKGASIRLEKKLPMGGGLGGGSSDAATTLVALNRLWNLNLDNNTLLSLGLQLGADVPVFINGHAAWAEGVGEHLFVINPPEPWYLVVHPGVEISTAKIFASADLKRDCAYLSRESFDERAPVFDFGVNVCEPVVRKLYPEVDAALRWLSQFSTPRMTGTGACVVASFSDFEVAAEVQMSLPASFTSFIARGMNRSPLN